MFETKSNRRIFRHFALTPILAAQFAMVATVAVPFALNAVPVQAMQAGAADSQIQADLTKTLGNSKFKNIQSSVENGIVTLSGTVDVFATKEQADEKAHRIKHVQAVRNNIEVGGPEVSDAVIREKLGEKLAYDRVGYFDNAFNAITLQVENGVVTVGGHAYSPTVKDDALSLARNYPGVKDVIDNIEVDPTSPMDDRIRIAVARAIYGYGPLNKYAIDPQKSIRISVQSGNVTLYGVVDNEADKNIANIRANGVSGVFKVTNNLQVAGKAGENK